MNGSRILVVEDDARLAATLDRVLTAEGHHIEVVGDGMQALRLRLARCLSTLSC